MYEGNQHNETLRPMVLDLAHLGHLSSYIDSIAGGCNLDDFFMFLFEK